MSVLVWAMVGIALWHFAVLVPDRFLGGIIGAFVVALLGALASGYALPAPGVPHENPSGLGEGLWAIPGVAGGAGGVVLVGRARRARGGPGRRGGPARLTGRRMGGTAHGIGARRRSPSRAMLISTGPRAAGADVGDHGDPMSLFWRVVLVNVVVLVLAGAALVLSPATVSPSVRATEVLVLAAGMAVVVAVNVVILRRVFAPLRELTALMRRIDPMEPGRRIELDGSVTEVAQLEDAFNDMLDRLERERRTSGKRALDAQERERRRLARELHDELGQTLTGIVLLLQGLAREAPPELQPSVGEVQEAGRGAVEKTRDLARGLRPQALDEFGLRSALVTLATGFADRSGLRVRHEIAADLPPLAPEHDLAIYRTAQESLTNVARHADATAVVVALSRHDGGAALSVRDDGRGVREAALHDAGGVGGMRERAMLVGGRLEIRRSELGGTEVRLEVPGSSAT